MPGASDTVTVTGFNTLPADDLLTIEGVEQVSRVGRYPRRTLVGSDAVHHDACFRQMKPAKLTAFFS